MHACRRSRPGGVPPRRDNAAPDGLAAAAAAAKGGPARGGRWIPLAPSIGRNLALV
jgi:hypothetical protein